MRSSRRQSTVRSPPPSTRISDCGLTPPATLISRASTPARVEGLLVQSRRVVVAQLAHVAGAQSPGLAGNHRGCRLPSRHHAGRAVLHLRAARRVIGQGNQRVRGVQSHAHQVDLRQLRHADIVIGSGEKPALRLRYQRPKCCRLKTVFSWFWTRPVAKPDILAPVSPSAARQRALIAAGVSLETLARRFGTPLYVYSADQIAERLRLFQQRARGPRSPGLLRGQGQLRAGHSQAARRARRRFRHRLRRRAGARARRRA